MSVVFIIKLFIFHSNYNKLQGCNTVIKSGKHTFWWEIFKNKLIRFAQSIVILYFYSENFNYGNYYVALGDPSEV